MKKVVFYLGNIFRNFPRASLWVLLEPIHPSIMCCGYSKLSPMSLKTLDKNHLGILLSPKWFLPSTSKHQLARSVMEAAMTFPYTPFFCAFFLA